MARCSSLSSFQRSPTLLKPGFLPPSQEEISAQVTMKQDQNFVGSELTDLNTGITERGTWVEDSVHAGAIVDFPTELCWRVLQSLYTWSEWLKLHLKALLKGFLSSSFQQTRSKSGSWGALYMILAGEVNPWVPRVAQSIKTHLYCKWKLRFCLWNHPKKFCRFTYGNGGRPYSETITWALSIVHCYLNILTWNIPKKYRQSEVVTKIMLVF